MLAKTENLMFNLSGLLKLTIIQEIIPFHD